MAIPPALHLQYVEGYVPKAWFLKKNQVTLPKLEIPCVDDAATEQICPVHTTVKYLDLVKNDRAHAQTSLVIPHNPANQKNVAIQAIPRYIVRLVRWAYMYYGLDPPETIRGHDTRGVAASLAALTGVGLADVLASGNWSSAQTFLRHYFRRFSPDCITNLQRIPSVVAGKQLIFPSRSQAKE